jgi:hypothetical protein
MPTLGHEHEDMKANLQRRLAEAEARRPLLRDELDRAEGKPRNRQERRHPPLPRSPESQLIARTNVEMNERIIERAAQKLAAIDERARREQAIVAEHLERVREYRESQKEASHG